MKYQLNSIWKFINKRPLTDKSNNNYLLWRYDQEIFHYYTRWNFLLDIYVKNGAADALELMIAINKKSCLSKSAYCCSSRIINYSYLIKLFPEEYVRCLFGDRVEEDLAVVIGNLEFNKTLPKANNHLLQNYRAILCGLELVLNNDLIDRAQKSLTEIDDFVLKYWSAFFAPDQPFILLEGSTSYEFEWFRSYYEISRSMYPGKLVQKFRLHHQSMLVYVEKYRHHDKWIQPCFGDITPNYRMDTLVDFLEFITDRRSNTVHKKIYS